jgi:16S rRNA (guanine1207-N2)-methyltransferase
VSSDHYFASRPGARSARRSVTLTLPDGTVTLTTDAGVFAGDRIDRATQLLLAHGPSPPRRGELLDLGCGYGPIAVTLARRSPTATVWAVDVNERALALCRENVRALDLANVRVCPPEEVPPDLRFTGIWSNPPIRIGKAALHDVLSTWLGRLAPDGRAHLVVSKHLGADSLARWLAEQGLGVSRRASRQGYRLLDVT